MYSSTGDKLIKSRPKHWAVMEEIGKGLSLDAPIRPVFHTIKQPWNQKAAVITWPLGSSGKEGGSFGMQTVFCSWLRTKRPGCRPYQC